LIAYLEVVMQTEKQDQEERNQDDKVVSIFDRNKTSQKSAQTEQQSSEPDYDFETTMRRNLENKSKLQKERSKSNRGVIRSYRLKN